MFDQPPRQKGRGFYWLDALQGVVRPITRQLGWLDGLRKKYATVFAEGLGACRTHVVNTFPFKYPLPWKQQPPNRMSGPAEEQKVLDEVLKLVKLGAVREVEHEPYFILAFGVPKKMGSTQLVLDFRKFNS